MTAPDILDGVPLVESPFFEERLGELPPAYRDIAKDLNRTGYAVFDFPDKGIIEKIDGIKRDFASRYDWDGWRAGKIDSLRIQDAWQNDPRVRDIAANAAVLDLLSALYGRRAFPFQTLNFAVGTQQAGHADYVHFNSIPDRFMCGVWLAFEDVDEENGPLFYYPGSHTWPTYQNEHIGVSHKQISKTFPEYRRYVELWERLAQKQGLKREIFRARKGQALIWASNLVHGGSVQKDLARTRWSQVTHYFFEGCAYTTPLANDTYNGKVFYRDIVDIQTGKTMPNVVTGEVVGGSLKRAMRPALDDKPSAPPPPPPRPADPSTSRYRAHPDVPADFDPAFYIEFYGDLAAAGVDPYQHYVQHGKKEGRQFKRD